MDPLTAALAQGGLSLLGGVLGGGAARGAQKRANQYRDNGINYLNASGDLIPQYQHFAGDATSAYDQFQPQSIAATQDLADLLRTDKYTDDYSTASLNKATAGTTDAYLRAKANIGASMAERGISDSNVAEGARIGNENALAATRAGAQNDLALDRINSRDSRLQGLVNLLTGATSANRGAAEQSLGEIDNTNRYLSNAYTGLSGAAQGEADQTNAGVGGMFSDLGGLAALLASGGGKKKKFGLDPTLSTIKPSSVYIPNL